MNCREQLEQDLAAIEAFLQTAVPDGDPLYQEVAEAMRYSLLAGGKRIRALFVLECCAALGGRREEALPLAAAIEMVHAYSLIHDDLPCMDDDDLRRGKPSCHKVYGEATALLAGDALLTLAFETAAGAPLPEGLRLRAVAALARAAGYRGMIGGQVIDLAYENRPMEPEVLATLHRLKTGALLSVSAQLGAISASAGEDSQRALGDFAGDVGLAFQIADDILDAVGDEAKLGKPIGSDIEQGKTTFVTLYGVEASREQVRACTDRALCKLQRAVPGEQGGCLAHLCQSLVDRES
ncbi:polyprenyl synthetase family protein [Bittarella massiliensis (ex Durand et al. 2017)]|uniref:polyprenyl synthetase family protein n=1 Tax=Bittarella massiliensis (ex Durand et al. 2017) TaxID=1720313 RepID=UPI00073F9656|nr:farnesyl diphosphate synthase [Bittarella massiliensis (ex Durand et al. 2017)]